MPPLLIFSTAGAGGRQASISVSYTTSVVDEGGRSPVHERLPGISVATPPPSLTTWSILDTSPALTKKPMPLRALAEAFWIRIVWRVRPPVCSGVGSSAAESSASESPATLGAVSVVLTGGLPATTPPGVPETGT